jgi:predicted transcriptional regulator
MSRGRISETTYRVLRRLGRAEGCGVGCRPTFLAAELDISLRAILNCLARLAQYGWVERTKRGWYRITELGWERLEQAVDEGPRGVDL